MHALPVAGSAAQQMKQRVKLKLKAPAVQIMAAAAAEYLAKKGVGGVYYAD